MSEPIWVSANTAIQSLDVSRSYFDKHIKEYLTPIFLGKSEKAGIRYDYMELKSYCDKIKEKNCSSLTDGEITWKQKSEEEKIGTMFTTSRAQFLGKKLEKALSQRIRPKRI